MTTTNIGLLLEDDPGVSGKEAHFCHTISITCFFRMTTSNICLLLEDDPGVSGTDAHFCHYTISIAI